MVEIHPEGRIIDPKYSWMNIDRIQQSIEKGICVKENKKFLYDFIQDGKRGKTIKKGQKKKVGIARLVKYVQDLKKLDEYFQKPFDKVTEEEMDKFIEDLEDGKVCKKNGQAYADETQVCIKNIVIKFYKWLLCDSKSVPDIVASIDTSFTLKDYKAISEDQVNSIISLMTSNTSENIVRNKTIVMFLFDSGCRADELLNIRLKDLSFDNGNYKARILFSKTKKRTIILPLCKKYLDEWLDIHPARDKRMAQLFPLSYSSLCNMIKRSGKRIGEHVTPHALRHTAETYWASRLFRYQLCYRFGWSMSSRQPDRYIDQEGLDQEQVIETVRADNVSQLKEENSQLNKRLAVLEEQLERLMKKDREELKTIIAKVLNN